LIAAPGDRRRGAGPAADRSGGDLVGGDGPARTAADVVGRAPERIIIHAVWGTPRAQGPKM